MNQTYDAIIIGAGVMGASLAFHLAERGLKPAILERTGDSPIPMGERQEAVK